MSARATASVLLGRASRHAKWAPTIATEPVNNTQGCREDYTCYWGRGDGDPSGFCDVGVFNDVTVNNIGSECVSDDECYSPFGYGLAVIPDFGCTVIECRAAGRAGGYLR